VLQKVRSFASELKAIVAGDDRDQKAARERRINERHDLTGFKVVVRQKRAYSTFHIKDLSCTGMAGISDIPLPVGAFIFVQLKKPHFRGAEVRWVRNAMIGLQFYRPLQPEFVEKLFDEHLALRELREEQEEAVLQIRPGLWARNRKAAAEG